MSWSVLKHARPIPFGYEASILIGPFDRTWCISFGWGYDKEIPLRPWPQYTSKTLPRSKSTYRAINILGFFICLGTL